jgi:hypothetical protein
MAASEKIDVAVSNDFRVQRAGAIVSQMGFDLHRSTCSAFTAGIGTGSQRYQLCKANLR